MARWNPADHPRDQNGKFRPKGSGRSSRKPNRARVGATPLRTPMKAVASAPAAGGDVAVQGIKRRKGKGIGGTGRSFARASLSSATVGYTRSWKLPKSYSVHATALVRIEKDDNALSAYLDNLTNGVLLKLAESIPSARISNFARQAIEKRRVQAGGTSIDLPRGRRAGSKSIKLTRFSGGPGNAAVKGSKTRTRSARRSRATRGTRVRG